MKVSILRWHDANIVEPETDGTFLVWPKTGPIRDLSFTVEAGWNTYYDDDGKLIGASPDEKREDWNRYVRLWAHEPKEAIELA